MGKNLPFASRFLWLFCALLLTDGCHWSKSGTANFSRGEDPEVRTSPYPDSSRGECARLAEENAALRLEVKTRDLDIAKLAADLQYQKAKNRHLEQHCRSIQEDLAQAEKQFISIEQRLQLKETKASAVAALAEAKLAYDKYRSLSAANADVEFIEEIERKLGESCRLIEKENYSASVYYSKRVHKMLERSPSTRAYLQIHGETRIVAVAAANLRGGPGLDHEIVGRLRFGTILVQVEQSEEWSKIATEEGLQGWIHRDLIR